MNINVRVRAWNVRPFILCVLSLTLACHTADPIKDAAWPQANGPHGNFNPHRYGVRLVDDLNKVRRVWVSAYRDLGFAKGSSSGYVRHLTEPDTHGIHRHFFLPFPCEKHGVSVGDDDATINDELSRRIVSASATDSGIVY